MNSVDTRKDTFATVTQVVYETAFESNQKFREITEEQAQERRAEEASREQAKREKQAREEAIRIEETAAKAKAKPSVIVDLSSAVAENTAASTQSASADAPKHAVNVLA